MGLAMFFTGLILFMLGIYLSLNEVVLGSVLGVLGGMILGFSSYFFVTKKA